MKAGIIGLPTVGKTTLFNVLTRCDAPVSQFGGHRGEARVGVISVPDERFDNLVRVYKPKKVSPAAIEVIDGAAPIGIDRGGKFGTDFFTGIRSVDALIHVVRAFSSSSVPEPENGLDPLRDLASVNDELMLADLGLVETRLERIEKGLRNRKVDPNNPAAVEKDLMLRIRAHMEEEKPLKTLELTPDEVKSIRSFDFLTLKPMIVVVNLSEDHDCDTDGSMLGGLREFCASEGMELIEFAACVEAEIAQLPPEEEKEYMEAMGIKRPARDMVVQSAFRALGLISFFTFGEDEVKAWTIRKGEKAVEAAGEIHSDLARGFIRAEILSYGDYEAAGAWEAAKSAGKVRLESKDYVMKDGDMMIVRFKV